MRKLFLVLVAGATALFSAALYADDYPSRPVTIVNPFGPGSGSDTVCRIIANKLGPALGQPVVVEDRPGADGALAALSGVAQTIPFLPSNYGGTMPNAVVSPLYLATGANSPFGAANYPSNSYISPKFLQASLAVNGQGASQTSALVVTTGNFFTYGGSGAVVAAGPVRGTVMLNASSPAVHIGAGLATVPDGNGNNLFGGNTLSGFVLDQNEYNFSGTYVPSLASAAQFGTSTVNYAFNQPVTTTPLPANIPGTQQALGGETGYFGGIIAYTSNPTTGSPYVLNGVVALNSNLNTNRVAATFEGGDPFTSEQSRISLQSRVSSS